ncbi:MAG: HAD-IA family hydrolase [Pseudomonadota bacterium]|jgi:phosphoglycolate phosphatase|uniref:Similar to phosphoglycolate phosphatase,clustered with ribosomal large subunit pseudouridine synthase C n=1 Tax=hydrothermal vent metagenome TaxID=652676 RepID=A0A160TJZ6_9ZZZZ
MTNRLALFDCDGTLVDSQANICRSMEEAFVLGGLEAPRRDAIRRIIGLSVVEAVAALSPELDDARHRALAEEYKASFFRLRASGAMDEEPLFEDMIDTLDVLAKAGWLFGVATGKSDRGLARILAHHGIADRFVTLQTADRHPSKPHPSMIELAMAEAGASPETTVMIGDTSYDMLMARAAGTRALGVAWGYHPPEELLAAGAHVVATTVASLPEHMETV